MVYAFQYGAYGPVHEGPGKDGAQLSLVRAIRECHGVNGARVLRLGADGAWHVIIRNAGSAFLDHVPSGRTVTRRRTARAQRRTLAESMTAAHDLGRHTTRDPWWDNVCPACQARVALLDACAAASAA